MIDTRPRGAAIADEVAETLQRAQASLESLDRM